MSSKIQAHDPRSMMLMMSNKNKDNIHSWLNLLVHFQCTGNPGNRRSLLGDTVESKTFMFPSFQHMLVVIHSPDPMGSLLPRNYQSAIRQEQLVKMNKTFNGLQAVSVNSAPKSLSSSPVHRPNTILKHAVQALCTMSCWDFDAPSTLKLTAK